MTVFKNSQTKTGKVCILKTGSISTIFCRQTLEQKGLTIANALRLSAQVLNESTDQNNHNTKISHNTSVDIATNSPILRPLYPMKAF